jgi:hypothetical protein
VLLSPEGGASQGFDRQYGSIVDRRQVVDVAAISSLYYYMNLRISMLVYTVVYLLGNKLYTIFKAVDPLVVPNSSVMFESKPLSYRLLNTDQKATTLAPCLIALETGWPGGSY